MRELGLHYYYKNAFDRADAAIERQLAHETELLERGSVQLFGDRDHSKRDRKIEAWAFFFNVGWRQINRRSLARSSVGAVADGSPDPILALFYRRIRQTDNDHLRFARPDIDLDFDFVGVHAVNGGGIDFGQHRGDVADLGWQKIVSPQSRK